MPPKKQPKSEVPKLAPMVALLIGLVLSAYNLSLMTSTSGRADGLDDALEQSQLNYRDRGSAPAPKPPTPEPAQRCEPPRPPVLFSVVKYREGEEASLQANLVAPLMSYYAGAGQSTLSAVLIERKNASSRDVNVRLFFVDGTETSYLWPSTNSKDGVWTPPDAMMAP